MTSPTSLFLGYELGTGDEVNLPLHHMIVTGITQLSGKTTTLEALLDRARGSLTALAFITKRGERFMPEAPRIPPFFQERSDWQYVAQLLEATLKEKMRMERSWIIRATKGTTSLEQVRDNLTEQLEETKIRAWDRDMCTNLVAYLDIILPQLRAAPLVNTLELTPGVPQVMDLSPYSPEVQVMVVRSAVDEIYANWRNVVLVLPELHKFSPQGGKTPAKPALERLIREGGALNNWIWADSQDIAGTDKGLLKQCDVWLLGRQREKNEAEHTVDQVPLPKRERPRVDEVMQLQVGQFIACFGGQVRKIYVVPSWMDRDMGRRIALGEEQATASPRPVVQEEGDEMYREEAQRLKLELTSAREQLSAVGVELQERLQELKSHSEEHDAVERLMGATIEEKEAMIRDLQDTDHEAAAVLAELRRGFMSLLGDGQGAERDAPVDVEAITAEVTERVLARMPQGDGVVVTLAPVPALEEVFSGRIKDQVRARSEQLLQEVKSLPTTEQQILAVLATKGGAMAIQEVARHLGKDIRTSGSARNSWSIAVAVLVKGGWAYRDGNKKGFRGRVALKVQDVLRYWDPTPDESEAVVQNILATLAPALGVR